MLHPVTTSEGHILTPLTVNVIVQAPIEKVWLCFNSPEHIVHWNQASDEWHAPSAAVDFRIGGKFSIRMEAKDGSFGFDYHGIYTHISPLSLVAYNLGYDLGESRTVETAFVGINQTTQVRQSFIPETVHPIELQLAGWQAILDSFKRYTQM